MESGTLACWSSLDIGAPVGTACALLTQGGAWAVTCWWFNPIWALPLTALSTDQLCPVCRRPELLKEASPLQSLWNMPGQVVMMVLTVHSGESWHQLPQTSSL